MQNRQATQELYLILFMRSSLLLIFLFLFFTQINLCMQKKVDLRVNKYLNVHNIVDLKDCQDAGYKRNWRLRFSPCGKYIVLFRVPLCNQYVQNEYMLAINPAFSLRRARMRGLANLYLAFSSPGEKFSQFNFFDAETGEKKIEIDGSYLFMFSRDGKYLAIGGKLIDLKTCKAIPIIEDYNKNILYFYEFNESNDLLAIFSYKDDNLILFDLKKLRPCLRINNKIQYKKLEDYEISSYGKYLAIRTCNGNLKIFDIREEGKENNEIFRMSKVDSSKYAFSYPDSRYLGYISNGNFYLIDLEGLCTKITAKKYERIIHVFPKAVHFEFCNDSRHVWVCREYPFFSGKVFNVYLFDILKCKLLRNKMFNAQADLVIGEKDCNNGTPKFSPAGKYFCYKKRHKKNIFSRQVQFFTTFYLINLCSKKKEKLKITIPGIVCSQGDIFSPDDKCILVCDNYGVSYLIDLDSYDYKTKRFKTYNLNLKNIIDMYVNTQNFGIIYEERNAQKRITGLKGYMLDLPKKETTFYRSRLLKNRKTSDLVIKTMYASKEKMELKRKLDKLYPEATSSIPNGLPNEYESQCKRRKLSR